MAEHRKSKVNLCSAGWLVCWATLISAALHLGSLQKNLPYVPEVDESVRVSNSVRMVASGTLNPRFFTHPGTTTFYPMAGMYCVWGVTAAGADPLQPGPGVRARFAERPYEFFLLGRLLSAVYSVLTIPLVFLLGRRAFGARAALAATWLTAFYPLLLYYGTTVRTDTAATFFGMLSLWLCFRVLGDPTRRNHLYAGLAIGAACASRYFMLALVPVLLLADFLVFLRAPSGRARAELMFSCLFGLVAAAATFVILNPYIFLDAGLATEQVRHEARGFHPGADGLSRVGNFVWYLTHAIPRTMTWPQTILAGVGVLMVLVRPRAARWVLAGYALAFLAAISALPLHWQRWVIQVVPILALLAALALDRVVGWVGERQRWDSERQSVVLAVAVAALCLWPGLRCAQMAVRFSRPSTQIRARAWILDNIPPGSRIAQDFYGPPIENLGYNVFVRFSLSNIRTVEEYRREGFEYIVTCSQVYDRYFQQPARYARGVAFYETLARDAELLQEFGPSALLGGPTIRIYHLVQPENVARGGCNATR